MHLVSYTSFFSNLSNEFYLPQLLLLTIPNPIDPNRFVEPIVNLSTRLLLHIDLLYKVCLTLMIKPYPISFSSLLCVITYNNENLFERMKLNPIIQIKDKMSEFNF